MRVTDALLVAGASARMSRLVTSDTLGDHYVVTPLTRLAHEHDVDDWLVSGLECPFCVGFWIGSGVLASYALAERHPSALTLWRLAAGAFALNYVVGHISSRLD